ncbi:MAG TPA: hypothetical protein VGN83_05385 [Falsiroseomonas sp.]|jgi:hypothetical protein|nr:hypothetical protein [Falsiroseomonas sp.]
MSTETPITRDSVEFAYRFLLGRPPESEKAYQYGLSAGTVEALRRWIMASPEFADKLRRDAPIAVKRCLAAEQQARAAARKACAPADSAPDAAAPARRAPAAPRPRVLMDAFFLRNIVIHTHIEKCAGTSLVFGLQRMFGPPTCLDLRKPKQPDPRAMAPEHRARIRLLTGHFHYGRHEEPFGRNPLYIATVRDPVARLVSFLAFLRRSETHPQYPNYGELPIGEAVEKMVTNRNLFLRNGQCLALSRAPSFEAARASIEAGYTLVLPHASANRIPALFAHAFGLPPPKEAIWVNATAAKPPEIVPDAALVAQIRALNAEDDRLYRWVLENEGALFARAAERVAALVAAAAPLAAEPDQNTKRVPTSTDRPGAAKPLAGS